MKAFYKYRNWASSIKLGAPEWEEKSFNNYPVRITKLRIYIGDRKFDRVTGKSLDKFNPHVKTKVLLRLVDDNGKVILRTTGDEDIDTPGLIRN